MGNQEIVYIDNMLILAKTREETSQHLEVLLFLLESVGFIVNRDKSYLDPAQELEFLGLLVDSQSLQLNTSRREDETDPQGGNTTLISEGVGLSTSTFAVSRKINVASQAMLVAPLFYQALQKDLQAALVQGAQDYKNLVRLSKDSKEELNWWQYHLAHWNGRTVIQRQTQIAIQSDASLTGWGAVCNRVSTGGSWSLQEKTMHINCLELLAADLAVKAFLKDYRGISVLLQLANSTAVAYINNVGRTVLSTLTFLAKSLWLWALERNIVITARHIPGVSNTVADLRVEAGERSVRLDAGTQSVPDN